VERRCERSARTRQHDGALVTDRKTAAAHALLADCANGRGEERTMSSSKTTTDHKAIRRWVEERKGKPARVKDTERGSDDIGLLRIDFPGYSGEGKLEPIEWEDFFDKFEESQLAFVYQDKTEGGELSHFNKLVSR
jgi:hypothetical protein